MNYKHIIFLTIIIAVFSGVLFNCIFNNIAASISIFAAILVVIQFILNRYENRVEISLKMHLEVDDNGPFLRISITNSGGKTIYLKSGGIISEEKIKVDFDAEVPNNRPLFSANLRNIFPFDLMPGQTKTIRKETYKILLLLKEKEWRICENFTLKGYFIDQLNREYFTNPINFSFNDFIPPKEKILDSNKK